MGTPLSSFVKKSRQPGRIELRVQGATATILLDNQAVQNAINEAMMEEWENALDRIEGNGSIRCIVLTGAGDAAFCSGGDLGYFATLKDSRQVWRMVTRMQKILRRLYLGAKVAIAAVNGAAVGGGCEILTACHLRMAAASATFSFRQARNGIVCGWGGTHRLMNQLGGQKALELLLTSRIISAEEALQMGLIGRVAPAGKVLSAALETADEISRVPPDAVTTFLDLQRNYSRVSVKEFQERENEAFQKLWFQPTFLRKAHSCYLQDRWCLQKILASYR